VRSTGSRRIVKVASWRPNRAPGAPEHVLGKDPIDSTRVREHQSAGPTATMGIICQRGIRLQENATLTFPLFSGCGRNRLLFSVLSYDWSGPPRDVLWRLHSGMYLT
jgi:hypothetical protein